MTEGPVMIPVLIPIFPEVVTPLTTRLPILYDSVPVPTTPFDSLFTSSYHAPP